MRRVDLHHDNLVITLSGLTMLEALQGKLVIPYRHIIHVHARLRIPPRLLRVGGTTLGAIHEGHYIGEHGWYFLSYEHPDHIVTLDLDSFYLGRQPYLAVAIEVDDPETLAEAITQRMTSTN